MVWETRFEPYRKRVKYNVLYAAGRGSSEEVVGLSGARRPKKIRVKRSGSEGASEFDYIWGFGGRRR